MNLLFGLPLFLCLGGPSSISYFRYTQYFSSALMRYFLSSFNFIASLNWIATKCSYLQSATDKQTSFLVLTYISISFSRLFIFCHHLFSWPPLVSYRWTIDLNWYWALRDSKWYRVSQSLCVPTQISIIVCRALGIYFFTIIYFLCHHPVS